MFSESTVPPDPFHLFADWFSVALERDPGYANAMTLASATAAGKPAARIVLLKGQDAAGFVFFTNYESRKGLELLDNPAAAALFHWSGLQRQVRIEGMVERVSSIESDAYYQTRPLGSRLGAWASAQSQVLPDRASLERRLAEITVRFGEAPARPPHWGGSRLRPESIEFWQGRADRLHDRLRYMIESQGTWRIERLAP